MTGSYNIIDIGCEYASSIMTSSQSLNQFITSILTSYTFLQIDPYLQNRIWMITCMTISVCGVSSNLRKLAAIIIFIVRIAYYGITVSIGDSLHATIHHHHLQLLESSFRFLDFCLIACIVTIALRQLEYNYGPRRCIPDPHRSSWSIDYQCSHTIRRCRQLVELVLYTLIPGFYFHCLVFGEDASSIAQKLGGYCGNWTRMIQSFRQDANLIEFMRDYVVIIIGCGTFQRVFGSNPSYKDNIHDQYGKLIYADVSGEDDTCTPSLTSDSQDDVELNSPPTSSSKRKSSGGVKVLSLRRKEQSSSVLVSTPDTSIAKSTRSHTKLLKTRGS